ncbi:MAG: cytochrome c [Sandaracinus sp.]|nr:cytochrome c [Myxococcales bacterium]MCB9632093.1 cytochrome c [Sandaracinus sp.]
MRLLSFLLLAALGCGEPPLPEAGEWTAADHVQPARSQGSTTQAAPRSERSADPLAAAAALWTVTCASCHGRTGLGDGPSAPGPLVSFANPEWQQANDDATIAQVITRGRNAMPPFGDTIQPSGVEALVALIRRFGGDRPTPVPTPGGEAPGGEAPSGEAPSGEAPSEGASPTPEPEAAPNP